MTPRDLTSAADNAKLALGRKANLGLVEALGGQERRLLRPRLPFVPYAPYDCTAGSSSRLAAVAEGDGAAALDEGGGGEEAAAALPGGSDEGGAPGAAAGHLPSAAVTQRQRQRRGRPGETELSSVGVET